MYLTCQRSTQLSYMKNLVLVVMRLTKKNSILHVNQFQFKGQFQLSLKMARLGNGSFPSKIAQLSFNQVRQKEKQRWSTQHRFAAAASLSALCQDFLPRQTRGEIIFDQRRIFHGLPSPSLFSSDSELHCDECNHVQLIINPPNLLFHGHWQTVLAATIAK